MYLHLVHLPNGWLAHVKCPHFKVIITRNIKVIKSDCQISRTFDIKMAHIICEPGCRTIKICKKKEQKGC